jgi:3-oxoacyl-[acyl-carrier protein] reductase
MYAAAKRAILGLTRDLAKRHGRQNIRINAILPGFLDNRMTKSVSEKRRESVRNDHALGRWNTMDRVAAFVRFLHEQMPHTSGQWFQLDSRDSLL